MSVLCSALIPTRARKDKLIRCIESILATVSDPANVEIIIRYDDDDTSMKGADVELGEKYNVLSIIGPRFNGWDSNAEMFDEMILIQQGEWCFFFNDDATIQPDSGAEPWDSQLLKVPKSGFIVHPGVYGLGGSGYPKCGGAAFPIVPKYCWRQYGWKQLCHPLDHGLDVLLVHRQNWKNWFLEGIRFQHDREPSPGKPTNEPIPKHIWASSVRP